MLKTIFKNLQTVYLKKANGAVCFSSHKTHNQEFIPKQTEENRGAHYRTRQRILDVSFETNALMSVFPEIHDEILNEQLIYHKADPDLRERYSKLINYNINLDQRFLARAIFLVHAYRLLEKPSLLTEDNLRKACILGWSHKLIDGSLIIDDDIVDRTKIRYKKPTWHSLEDIGVDKAIHDAAFLECGAHFLLTNHFSSHPQYTNMQRVLLRSYSYTNVAQTKEAGTYKVKDLEKNQEFVKSYAFTLPIISSALYLANNVSKDAHLAAEKICIEISRYIKIEDDVTCVFSPVSDIHKTCTDITEGRASWLAIEAYRRGNQEQQELLEENYGKKDQTSVTRVYNLFKELKLKEAYDDFKEEFYERMYLKINNETPKTLPRELFIHLLDYVMSEQYRV